MLVKWVRCTVVDRPGFARAQRKWAGLPGEPGFRGQGGGWSRTRDGVVHLFGFWDSRAFYDSFMARSHDRLHASQVGTYKNAQVRLFEYRFDVKTGFRPVFTDADLLRVAHCRVRPDRAEHYILMQEKVWNPAMAGSPGMLRGIFAQAHLENQPQARTENRPRIGPQASAGALSGSGERPRSESQTAPEDEFLVLSMWDSAAEHGKYRPERVERLALRAQTGADITDVTGDVIDLEPGWTV
ncbi:YdbC family protein [Streptomyces axinellae]|uniref:YdbC family protein n=1 Tax=Streptomyces axinellae TaxID=552788 RepID=A0ABP6CTK8_9ACTN